MKKSYKILRWVILILLIVLFLLIFAKSVIDNNPKKNEEEKTDYSNIKPALTSEISDVIVDNKIEMVVNEANPITLILKINNKTKGKYYYNDEFALEEMIDGKWYKLRLYEEMKASETFNDILSKEIHTKSYEWKNVYGKLSVGKYRIIKYFTNEKGEKSLVSSAEFMIN